MAQPLLEREGVVQAVEEVDGERERVSVTQGEEVREEVMQADLERLVVTEAVAEKDTAEVGESMSAMMRSAAGAAARGRGAGMVKRW